MGLESGDWRRELRIAQENGNFQEAAIAVEAEERLNIFNNPLELVSTSSDFSFSPPILNELF